MRAGFARDCFLFLLLLVLFLFWQLACVRCSKCTHSSCHLALHVSACLQSATASSGSLQVGCCGL